MIILIKKKWLATADITHCLACILVDDFEQEKEALKQATTDAVEAISELDSINYFTDFAEMNLYLIRDIISYINKDAAVSAITASFRDKRIMRQLASRHTITNPLFAAADQLLICPKPSSIPLLR